MKFVVQRRSTPIGSYTSSNAFLWNICDDGYQSQSLICAVRAHMCVTQWYDLLALRSPRVCGSETCNISIDILFSVQMKLKPYATHLNCVWRKRNGMGGQDLFFAFCRLFCEFNFLVFLFLNEKKKRKLVGSRHTLQCPREWVWRTKRRSQCQMRFSVAISMRAQWLHMHTLHQALVRVTVHIIANEIIYSQLSHLVQFQQFEPGVCVCASSAPLPWMANCKKSMRCTHT